MVKIEWKEIIHPNNFREMTTTINGDNWSVYQLTWRTKFKAHKNKTSQNPICYQPFDSEEKAIQFVENKYNG
jgi:hypothetical protein